MTDTTPERIWVRYSPNSHGAYVSSCEPSDVDDLDVAFVHADIHAAVVAERDQLKAALERQGDNLAFVLNRVSLPEAWFEKFDRELQEDRKALEKNDG